MSMQDRLNKIMAQKRGFTDVVLEENSCILSDLRNEIINDNTVVVIESHKKHAEVYPSIIHYFLELGFKVHLYCLKEHLKENGMLIFVINKDQGAKSTIKDMSEFYKTEVLGKNKGFYVISLQSY